MTDYTDPEESLQSSTYFAIQQCRLAPIKTHDNTARDAYYLKVADAVMQQIKLSGWTITPLRMEKENAPSPPEVCSRTITEPAGGVG